MLDCDPIAFRKVVRQKRESVKGIYVTRYQEDKLQKMRTYPVQRCSEFMGNASDRS